MKPPFRQPPARVVAAPILAGVLAVLSCGEPQRRADSNPDLRASCTTDDVAAAIADARSAIARIESVDPSLRKVDIAEEVESAAQDALDALGTAEAKLEGVQRCIEGR